MWSCLMSCSSKWLIFLSLVWFLDRVQILIDIVRLAEVKWLFVGLGETLLKRLNAAPEFCWWRFLDQEDFEALGN